MRSTEGAKLVVIAHPRLHPAHVLEYPGTIFGSVVAVVYPSKKGRIEIRRANPKVPALKTLGEIKQDAVPVKGTYGRPVVLGVLRPHEDEINSYLKHLEKLKEIAETLGLREEPPRRVPVKDVYTVWETGYQARVLEAAKKLSSLGAITQQELDDLRRYLIDIIASRRRQTSTRRIRQVRRIASNWAETLAKARKIPGTTGPERREAKQTRRRIKGIAEQDHGITIDLRTLRTIRGSFTIPSQPIRLKLGKIIERTERRALLLGEKPLPPKTRREPRRRRA